MRAQLRAELLKQRSTSTGVGLLAGMLGVVLFAVALHALGLATENLGNASEQLATIEPGQRIGTLFAALAGALSITTEFRHGTIRPTLLVTPWRGRVIAAKVWAAIAIGTGFGLAAAALAAGAGAAGLAARGIEVQLDAGDYALSLAGGAAAGGLWAVIGVGIGAAVRRQVPALVGICTWLLFLEGVILGNFASTDAGEFLPGAAATAITGVGAERLTLLAPAAGLALLALYAAAAALVGAQVTVRRDVA